MKPVLILGLVTIIVAAATAAPQHKRYRPQAQPAGQIACTVAGCHRIPPNCHPEMGYTPWGTPTGFDIVVCR